jgi:hypothetical protein
MSAPTPTPYLRRDPNPRKRSGRTVMIAALVFFVLLIVAVVVPLIVIGLNNNGIKEPPGPAPSESVPISTP